MFIGNQLFLMKTGKLSAVPTAEHSIYRERPCSPAELRKPLAGRETGECDHERTSVRRNIIRRLPGNHFLMMKFHLTEPSHYASASLLYLFLYSTISTAPVSAHQTKVAWGMNGKSKYPMNVINLFMDKMLGKELESSLVMLKNILEKQ